MRTPSPTCEIITIGTELLLGQILDTNTTYLAQELGRSGITVRFRTAVGDHPDEIVQTIGSALGRCDMVLTTGGLGPTLDDVTREAVARAAEAPLEFRQDLMDHIESLFRRAGYQMPENNRRQAFVPQGSQAIFNPVGTAPAFISDVAGKPVVCLPGVPRELKYLLSREVIPRLRQRFNLTGHQVVYRVLKTVGIGESKVDSLIGDLIKPGENPEIGLLASVGEIKIRMAARAESEAEARSMIEPLEKEIRLRLGKFIFGENEDTLASVIDSLLASRRKTLAIVETFSAGLASERLHSLPSRRLMESRVIPGEKSLARWLGLEIPLALGEESARLLARKIRNSAGTDLGLAILGFPREEKEGYILNGCTAAVGEGIMKTFLWKMGGDNPTLQQRGAVIGLNTLRLALIEKTEQALPDIHARGGCGPLP
jgi:nicotinamide-nucleotide amidase